MGTENKALEAAKGTAREQETQRVPRMIVCAAIRLNDGRVVCGVRHFDELMRMVLEDFGGTKILLGHEQGFVDNRYQFLGRNEAWEVAEAAGQIRGVPPHPGCLFSEDLY